MSDKNLKCSPETLNQIMALFKCSEAEAEQIIAAIVKARWKNHAN